MKTTKTVPVDPVVLVGTRKGAFILKGDKSRRKWTVSGPMFHGHIVHHMVLDPRDNRTLLVAARTGHLGPTMFRSTNFGKSWKEVAKPPAFPKVPEGEKGLVLNHVFWLTPEHSTQPNVWYAGSSPQGLFRSEDGGRSWDGVAGFNDHPMRSAWTGGAGTPDGPKMHSINIDPRDPNHMYIGMSSRWSVRVHRCRQGLEAAEQGMQCGLVIRGQTYKSPNCAEMSSRRGSSFAQLGDLYV